VPKIDFFSERELSLEEAEDLEKAGFFPEPANRLDISDLTKDMKSE
jgi:hypothetical protein